MPSRRAAAGGITWPIHRTSSTSGSAPRAMSDMAGTARSGSNRRRRSTRRSAAGSSGTIRRRRKGAARIGCASRDRVWPISCCSTSFRATCSGEIRAPGRPTRRRSQRRSWLSSAVSTISSNPTLENSYTCLTCTANRLPTKNGRCRCFGRSTIRRPWPRRCATWKSSRDSADFHTATRSSAGGALRKKMRFCLNRTLPSDSRFGVKLGVIFVAGPRERMRVVRSFLQHLSGFPIRC